MQMNGGAMLLFSFTAQFHALLFIYVIHASLLPCYDENIHYLQKCIGNIEEDYFNPKDYIIFINSNKPFEHLKLISRAVVRQNGYEINNINNFVFFTFFKVDTYVLVGSEDITMRIIRTIMTTPYWNPKAKFVVVLNEMPKNLFIALNKFYIFNAVVLVPKSDELVEIYTNFPFDFSIPQIERGEPLHIDRCIKGKLEKNGNLFPNKLPKVWTNFTVRVLLFEYPPYVMCRDCEDEDKRGIEIRILRLISRKLGFKIRYIKKRFATWGKLLSDGSYDEVYGYLQNRKADIAIGIFAANYTENWYFDLAFPYLEDTYRWVVPTAKKQPSWKNIVQIFQWFIWLLILLSLFLVSVTLYSIGSRVSEAKSYTELLRCFLICLQCLLGQCVHRQPKRFGVRVVFIMWAFLSWLLAVGFQSHLTTALNFFSYDKQISNVQELIDSKLQIGFYGLLESLFRNKDTKEDSYIYENSVTCPLDNACLNKTAFQQNFATIKIKRYLDNTIYGKCYLDRDGRPLLYVFKKELSYILINMVFSKGYPMYENVNKFMFSLTSNGFIVRCLQKERYFFDKAAAKIKEVNIQADVLDIFEVQGIFALLLLGWLFSLTVFIAEHALKPEAFLG